MFIGQYQETKELLKKHEQEIIINFLSYDDNCCDIFCFLKQDFILFSISLHEIFLLYSLSLRNSLLKCNL